MSEVHLSKGTQAILDLHSCNKDWLIFQEELIETILRAAALLSGAKIKGIIVAVFSNGGYTLCLNLSESHLSIHTYPEYHGAFIDCFTCGDKCNPRKALEFIQRIFEGEGSIKTIERKIK